MPVLIGTSGWQYRSWRGAFYPPGLAVARQLEHYAGHFEVVEVNATFYRLPTAATFAAWAERTPDDFVVALKASRYLTHVRRLRQPEEPVRLLLERAGPLGPKLGPILVQLPPDLTLDLAALDRALAAFPAGVRVAVELRHPSWWTPDVAAVLSEHGAALCLADRAGPRTPLWRTAGWAYLRLHQGRASPSPCYGRAALSSWARRLAEGWGPEADVFVLFNNDTRACAVRDARRFAAAARRAGLSPTRVPGPGQVRLAEDG